MVNFLAKLFIKDYKSTEKEEVRTKYGTMCGAFGIVTNIVLVIMKLIIGILSASISVIADAINNLSDCGSSIVTIVGFKISNKPADKEHPFGHQRVEYIVGLIIGMVILFVGVELLSTSIQKIINPDELSTGFVTYIILGVSILIKIMQGLFYFSASKKIHSISLKASGRDSLNDVIATTVVLIGLIISPYIGYNLDAVLGILVSGFIIFSSVGILKDAVSPLIGEKPDKDLIKIIADDVLSHEGVLGIHDLTAHIYGPSKIFVTLHVEVDSRVSVIESHDMIDNIEHEIKNAYGIEITIHMDPVEVQNQERIIEKEIVGKILSEIDPVIKFHDLRLVKGPTHTNVIFDILVPFNFRYADDELVKMIQQKVAEKSPSYRCVINVDKDFSN